MDGELFGNETKLIPSTKYCKNNLQNCTYYDLKDPFKPVYFYFRLKTTYPGGFYHLSEIRQVSVQEIFSKTAKAVWDPEREETRFPDTHTEEYIDDHVIKPPKRR
jgi:hypothetical protein